MKIFSLIGGKFHPCYDVLLCVYVNSVYVCLCVRHKVSFSLVTFILKQKSYVGLTFMSASSKCMNTFYSNFHLTNFDHLEMICTYE